MAKFDFVQRRLMLFFGAHGLFVAKHPVAVLLISLAIAAVMSSGVIFLEFENDTEKLFTPITSKAQSERDVLEDLFPTNFDMFTPSRVTSLSQRVVLVIVTAKDGENVLRKDIVAEVRQLRDTIVATTANSTLIKYESVCVHWNESCISNPVLEWWDYMEQINSTLVYLPTPFGQLSSGERVYFEGSVAPGLVENDQIVDTQALLLYFYLKHVPEEMNIQSGLWEDAVAEQLDHTSFSNIEVVYFTSDAVDEAQENLAISVLPYFCITFTVLTVFSVTTCLMTDWVQSKPWLANSGILSACLAIGSAVGLLSFCGVPFNQVVASMPFLAMGIGIDDMFIMVSAWRRTDRFSSVQMRMSKALSEAAVSITITSLTDFIGFCVAAITPLPAVRSFCLYTGVAILLDFFFQITFFASIMVFSGQREAKNKHCYTCQKVVPKEQSPSFMYRIFCSGGTGEQQQGDSPSNSYEHAVMKFFKKQYSPFITRPFVMILVLISYVLYIGFGIYGCSRLTEGLSISNLAEEGSMTNNYFKASSKYFNEYGPTVSVVITEELNYWEPDVQLKLSKLVTHFENNSYAGSVRSSEFWLQDLKKYADAINVSVSDRESFLSLLLYKFLRNPLFERYGEDINFDESGNITSSRFLITFGCIDSTLKESDLMIQTRNLADNNPEFIKLVVFSAPFIIYEQYIIVLPNTVQSLCIAIVSMLIIALLLIPSIPVAILVAASVVSIEVGVIGYMSLMGVSLDGISMINIVICIGFSVDFSAHICYAFVSQSSDVFEEERIANALCSLGFPILQSGVSTSLSLLPLLATKSYIFLTFAKINSLVMVFGMLHGLLFLPIFLTVIWSNRCRTGWTINAETNTNTAITEDPLDKGKDDFQKSGIIKPTFDPKSGSPEEQPLQVEEVV